MTNKKPDIADITTFFTQQVAHFGAQAEQASRRFNNLSVVRIAFFVLALVGLVYLANARYDGAFFGLFLVSIVGFPLLIRYHNRLRAQRDQLLTLQHMNEAELQRLELQLSNFDTGVKFMEPTHPYSGDLDIFGDHSLFQLVNRSATALGKSTLARWLLHPATRPELQQRQAAVRELSSLTEWRQTFQAYGEQQQPDEDDSLNTLLAWMQAPPALANRMLYTTLCYGLGLLTLTAIVLYFTLGIPGYVPIALLLTNGGILLSTSSIAADTHRRTTRSVAILSAYQGMMRQVEQQAFATERLQRLQAPLTSSGTTASQSVDRLRHILENFDARGNMFYHLFNAVFLLDIFWLLRADRWKARLQGDVNQWFDSISEMEALGSLASFAFAHPSFVMPTISGQQFVLSTQGMAHCLIPPQQRVANNFATEARGTITIITGSNMSGKSTFQRTVGVNVVLALAGAPVCAQQFEVSVMQIFTSMRTQDSLEENVSSFYAELRRLRQLLDMLQAPERPVLFMLDEILKGTNSKDRHHGAASLIKQLSKLEATGFVSTHDLELGQLEKTLPQVRNYSFTSTIDQDEIYFDYKLRKGICQSFNASKLMANMGIAVED